MAMEIVLVDSVGRSRGSFSSLRLAKPSGRLRPGKGFSGRPLPAGTIFAYFWEYPKLTAVAFFELLAAVAWAGCVAAHLAGASDLFLDDMLSLTRRAGAGVRVVVVPVRSVHI